MGMRKTVYNSFGIIIMLMGLGLSPVAAQDPPPLVFKGIYEFAFDTIRIGQMGIEIEETPTTYAITSDIVTSGLLKLIVKHSSHTTVDASAGEPHPLITYESNYQTRNKKKYVKMVYENGQVTETIEPPEPPGKRPPVPAALKNNAFDPLSFALAIRRSVLEARAQGKKTYKLNVYDGRRLTEASFYLKQNRSITYRGQPLQVTQVQVRRRLVAGFTQSELAKVDPDEPAVQMYVPLTGNGMPVRLEVRFLFGMLSATLVKECRTGESCLLGLR